ncbi:50S ribosomal protein L11 methyltransferase [Pseudoflavonifractor sp. BIOML-A6]|nr:MULTISPECIES: 50S ribosomal protein L11 methyltransferase [unclassified Pseudoflavonifractor]MTQ98381.1 50S ribosomal protein L11 methyltransferase [Pseudoflavonifractor sp. BIOML-A16]MTR06078.1 50S ribosomal protein L11 methyltransferase [Pseudoflavonifractor sp. BIOML-A15]MTR74627.1 50S ribosomal protein L11 methyltransferase [Pseudoflavonifractor sp. BIOML-A18]MTS63329.1 50S ribosomal protein L11 methyltransferase [Pseudoflavonifractor sp. BIOML-A5]MTS90283.1 50S ribosomal protein L11 me
MDDKWLEVSIDTTDAGLDELSAYLTRFDTGGLVIEGEAEFQAFLEQNRQYWDYVDEDLLERMRGVARVKFYVTDDSNGHGKLAQITDGLEAFRARAKAPGTLQVRTASLCEEDWANNWKQYYKPLSVGERLYIVPEWEKESGEVPAGRTALYLNPGLIFGTGSHASTQLCLEGVEACTRPGDAVLDLGCGSGILSIAALRLGGVSAVGVDIDPKAVGVAYENAGMNGIGRDRYTVRAGDVLSDKALAAELAERRYELVLANIVADVIIPLSAQVPGLLAEGGTFICSGIIDSRADEVRAAIESRGLSVVEKKEKNGWVAFVAKGR